MSAKDVKKSEYNLNNGVCSKRKSFSETAACFHRSQQVPTFPTSLYNCRCRESYLAHDRLCGNTGLYPSPVGQDRGVWFVFCKNRHESVPHLQFYLHFGQDAEKLGCPPDCMTYIKWEGETAWINRMLGQSNSERNSGVQINTNALKLKARKELILTDTNKHRGFFAWCNRTGNDKKTWYKG